MQSLTLCRSLSRVQARRFDPPEPLKSPCSPPRPLLRRYPWQPSPFVEKEITFFKRYAMLPSSVSHLNDESGEETSNSIKSDHDYSHVDMPPAEINASYELSASVTRDPSLLNEIFHAWFNPGLLFGLLTFQGPEKAEAASDVGGGMLSIPYVGDLGDISTGFASAFLLIFFSELGDKTFFIAALLAARNSGLLVFIGTFGALAAMTIISVFLGRTFHYVDEILPFSFGGTDLPIDDIAAVCLLVYFGISTLLEASSDEGLKSKEEQQEAELAISEFSGNGAGILSVANALFSTFTLVFVAEWGDKSFFSTIALAAASSPFGVVGGALAGHAVATMLAVIGGSLLGTFFSEKVIGYVGGVLFLLFAVATLVEIFN